MILALEIIFFVSALALIHSYVLYPILITFLSRKKKDNNIVFQSHDDWPFVTVLMAAYNEEKVMRSKIESLLNLDYPRDKLNIFIGSDNSTDSTNNIVNAFVSQDRRINFIPFYERNGKPQLINKLEIKSQELNPRSAEHIYLMTDASVILEEGTLNQLVKHYKNQEIQLVDAHMIYTDINVEGIAESESKYLSSEVKIKNAESRLWGKMIGPFGGCYTIRSNKFEAVPQNYLVDDFYIAMNALKNGGKAINEMSAKCFEKVSYKISEEYRRKRRISSGNFQNLKSFFFLLNPFSKLGFSFISHKVLRWLGPFFMILMICSSFTLMLKDVSWVFTAAFIFLMAWFFLIPLVNFILKSIKFPIAMLNNIHYFNYMNLALLHGFFDFIKGVRSSIWTPTER